MFSVVMRSLLQSNLYFLLIVVLVDQNKLVDFVSTLVVKRKVSFTKRSTVIFLAFIYHSGVLEEWTVERCKLRLCIGFPVAQT